MSLASVGFAIRLITAFGATEPKGLANLWASFFLTLAILAYKSDRHQPCKTLHRQRQYDAEAMPVRDFTFFARLGTLATAAVGR
jgi:hypothetical protein